jgi:hypothetical protein
LIAPVDCPVVVLVTEAVTVMVTPEQGLGGGGGSLLSLLQLLMSKKAKSKMADGKNRMCLNRFIKADFIFFK